MEFYEHGFVEEMSELFSYNNYTNAWSLDHLQHLDEFEDPSSVCLLPNSPSLHQAFSLLSDPSLEQGLNSFNSSNYNLYFPSFGNELLQMQHYSPISGGGPHFTDSSSYTPHDTPPFNVQEAEQYYNPSLPLMEEDREPGQLLLTDDFQSLGIQAQASSCKMEPVQESLHEAPVPVHDHNNNDMGRLCCNLERKISRANKKKSEGQPSKNLMAERRRRKRLNDRLSMLRSIVPKISKMDRTSILGDTIDYVRELIGKINNLQQENYEVDSKQLNVLELLQEMKPNEMLVRNSPKFQVERRHDDTRIEICCAGKPGLLLSTISTLEAFGLEVEQCVISCFSDFAIQASCSEKLDQRSLVSTEDIKQALFRNAGYGGRCL